MTPALKILNLYAGTGGNREQWQGHDVTAVEIDYKIRGLYREKFPNDRIIAGDAHQFLIENHQKFDFIWSSPPCPSHSRARFWAYSKKKPIYPDLTLYQEILFLQSHFAGLWVVENVKPYYKTLIPATAEVGRHLFWSNFRIGNIEFESNGEQVHKQLAGNNLKDKAERNRTDPEIGQYILNCALKKITHQNESQKDLFEP